MQVGFGFWLLAFLSRLAFPQLQCIVERAFSFTKTVAAQPSLFPSVDISDYLSLPFMLLTVMNFSFSWNGQNLVPRWDPNGLGGVAWTAMGKNKYRIVSSIRHINALYLQFRGDVEGGDKLFFCIIYHFPFFSPCMACHESDHRESMFLQWWVCTKVHVYHRGGSCSLNWVSAP